MGLPRTSLKDFAAHLDELGIQRGQKIVCHSSLLSFGDLERGAAGALDVLTDFVGSHGQLVFPTFTFQLGPNDLYDAGKTPPHKMGLLSEAALSLPGIRRGPCPIHNHVYITASTSNLGSPTSSVGADSSFEEFQTNNYKLLLLGTNLKRGGTYLHHVEAVARVPYRSWEKLPRTILGENMAPKNIFVQYYARNSANIFSDFSLLEQSLLNSRELFRCRAVLGSSSIIEINRLHAAAVTMLSDNPHALAGLR